MSNVSHGWGSRELWRAWKYDDTFSKEVSSCPKWNSYISPKKRVNRRQDMATRKRESRSFGVKNIPFMVQLIIKQSVAGASLAYFSGKAMEPHHHDSFRQTFYQAQDWHHLCGQGLANSATIMPPSGWWVSIPGDHINSQDFSFFLFFLSKTGRFVLHFPLGNGRIDWTASKLNGLDSVFVLLAMRKEMRIWVGPVEEKGNCGLCEYVPSYFRGMKRRHCWCQGEMGRKIKVFKIGEEEEEKAEMDK